MKTPGEPMDDKQRYMRQLEGTWDVRKLDFYYRRFHEEQGAEEAPEREAREVGASVGGRKTKRGQRSGEESRLSRDLGTYSFGF
jgi:hypothetical protein